MIRFRDVLKNRSFMLLWLGQIISNFGDRLNLMALFALVSKRAPGSTIGFAKLFFFMVIPVFVVGPIAGVYVDRWDRKKVMIISDILRGILVLLIPFFILSFNSFIPIYILVFLIFSITRFFLPSKMAVIPDIVPGNMLLLANTLSDTTRMIAAVVAFGIAGILVDKIGAINAFYIDSATFFISALFISNMVIKKIISHFREGILKAREAIKSAIRRTVWSDIREGIKFILEHKEMRFVVRNFFVLMAGVGSISCVIIVFIQDAFGSITKDFSLLLMFVVLGALISAMLYGRFGPKLRKEYVILSCILFGGVFITLFAVVAKLNPSFWFSAATMLMFGVSLGPIVVSINTTVHEFIPQETRGRIFSSLEAVIHLGFLVFMFIAALLAEHVDRIWILIFCGALFSVWGALGIFAKRRSKVV